MRLKNTLNEGSFGDVMGVAEDEDTVSDFNEIIQKECKPYLKLISASKEPLYRGMIGPRNNLGSKKVRQDRRTKLMDSGTAAVLNKWLGKNGFARRDKSVICSPREDTLKLFGAPFYIFPAGKIKYTYIESADMNWADSNSGWGGTQTAEKFVDFKIEGPNAFSSDGYLRNLRKPFKEFFHKDYFMAGYNMGYEFWIECSHYYFAPHGSLVWDNKYKALV